MFGKSQKPEIHLHVRFSCELEDVPEFDIEILDADGGDVPVAAVTLSEANEDELITVGEIYSQGARLKEDGAESDKPVAESAFYRTMKDGALHERLKTGSISERERLHPRPEGETDRDTEQFVSVSRELDNGTDDALQVSIADAHRAAEYAALESSVAEALKTLTNVHVELALMRKRDTMSS